MSWGVTFKEVLLGKTVLLLLGGLVIGFATTQEGYEKVSPFFVALLNGFLVLFLLHLGYMAGANFHEVIKVGALVLQNEDEVLAITSAGTVMRTPAAEVRQTGRDSMGVRLVNLDEGAVLLSVTKNSEDEIPAKDV